MAILKVDVQTEDISYPLKIERGLLNNLAKEIKEVHKNKNIAIVTDKNVAHYYGDTILKELETANFTVELIVLEPGEQTKSMENLERLFSHFIEFGLTRSDLIIEIGRASCREIV